MNMRRLVCTIIDHALSITTGNLVLHASCSWGYCTRGYSQPPIAQLQYLYGTCIDTLHLFSAPPVVTAFG